MTSANLSSTRPTGADAIIINDLPNEDGIPNHQPDPTQPAVDNHDTLTGSDATGKLYNTGGRAAAGIGQLRRSIGPRTVIRPKNHCG